MRVKAKPPTYPKSYAPRRALSMLPSKSEMSSQETSTPCSARFLISDLDGASAGFEGDGTLWNHARISAEHSSKRSMSSSLFAMGDLAAPEIAMSRAALLSTKKRVGLHDRSLLHCLRRKSMPPLRLRR